MNEKCHFDRHFHSTRNHIFPIEKYVSKLLAFAQKPTFASKIKSLVERNLRSVT